MKKWNKIYSAICRVFVITFVISILIHQNGWALNVSGEQSGTWTLSASPYIVTGDVVIPPGQKLTIEPGTVIKFRGFYQLKVQGTLIAQGESNRRIIFTSEKDVDFGGLISAGSNRREPGINDWSGIEFIETMRQPQSFLTHCIIRYSANVIKCDNSNPILTKILVADCNSNQLIINGKLVSIIPGRDNDILNEKAPAEAESLPIQTELAPTLDSILDVEEFSFDEVTVITASRKAQTQNEAPAIMTVVTAEDIRTRGYKTILEVLRDVPGFDINDNGNWVDTGIRGVNARVTYGKHIQYLLDGHDMGFKQFTRNLVSPSWVSMSNIKRIEIIRGPGSAVWGANAFLGVVNIITKDSEDIENFELVTSVGNFSTSSLSFQGGTQLNDDAAIYASFSLYQDNTSTGRKIYEWSQVAEKDVFVSNDKEVNYNLHLKANYRDFYFKGHFDRYDPYAPISTFSVGATETRFITDRQYINLSWEPTMNNARGYFDVTYQKYRFGAGAQYEDNPFNGDLVDLPPSGSSPHFIRPMKADDDFFKMSARGEYNISDDLWTVAGVEYEYLHSIRWYYPDVFQLNDLEEPKFNVHSIAAYAEAMYKIWPGLNATAGIRHDYHSIYGGVTNPRLGMVYNLPFGLYTKVLYGKAFKAPSLHEQYYFRKNAFYGNPTLVPEKIHTGEWLLGYNWENKILASANYYYSYATDIIGYQSRASDLPLLSVADFPESQWPDGTKSYNQQANNQTYLLSGIELESKYMLTENWSFYLNGALTFAKDKDTDARLYYTAEKFLGFGASYFAFNQARISLFGRYVGAKLLPERVFKEPGNPFNASIDETLNTDDYFIADFVVHVPEFTSENIFLTFKVNNITNQEYYDAGRDVLYAQMPRNFLGTIGIRY